MGNTVGYYGAFGKGLTECSNGPPPYQLAHPNIKRGGRLTWR